MKLIQVLVFSNLLLNTLGFVPSTVSPFNEWHCIDFVKNIDVKKPYAFNIGELPMVLWFKDKQPLSTINICEHMGSKLDHGKLTSDGCLMCPYHGLKYNKNKKFGDTIIFQDKIWWSYEPKHRVPYSVPFHRNEKFTTSYMTIDVDANFIDCAYNTMDINHPAYVHNNILGFGSDIPPTDVKLIDFDDNNKVGISFTYTANTNMVHLKREIRSAKNFHIYNYPYNTWSRVSLPNNQHLIINVDFLPLALDKTRWFITMKYNYWNNKMFEKSLMQFAANCILSQDKYQLSRQAPRTELKDLMIMKTKLKNEEHFDKLKDMFLLYEYPDKNKVLNLYTYHTKTFN